ncbi:hypothetical protein ED733_004647 [Metarhizium rileyi]|uniref:Uncharacterized protein n=1 Tax=Metarhizium rileyi (strain RCEF 4871) TaxID=1649241 RepID=A0A5C6G8P6_METRR|nr:hypothetical protein ED733_004647 [Metarhizium rileyi]
MSIPRTLPALTPKSDQPRFTESSVFPYLETNVSHLPMQFSQDPSPTDTSQRTRSLYADGSLFRHWKVVRSHITSLYERNGYEDLVLFSTTVERAEKVGAGWKRVVVVGASVSAADTAFDLTKTAASPIHAITIGHNFNGYFGGEAFEHPGLKSCPR